MERATRAAIDAGYRHIDCAWIYGNQDGVGRALSDKIQEGVITREDMFITTKVRLSCSCTVVELIMLLSFNLVQPQFSQKRLQNASPVLTH